ncbi:MAG: aldehyde dehydrogenase family protein [Acidobacteriota bacterium]
MADLPHVPVLRAGVPYRSLKVNTLHDIRTGAPVATVSQAGAGMIRRDLLRKGEHRAALAAVPAEELVRICEDAARRFAEDALPLAGDGGPGDAHLSPDDYVELLAATTGMPVALGHANLLKIVDVLSSMRDLVGGLTRGLDLAVIDRGWGEEGRRMVSYLPQADALGAVLPNNSPGVHGLWPPSLVLKTPLVLKPGSTEPWTPLRIAQALRAAGCPPEAMSIYPTDHNGAVQILLHTDRSLFFGDASTVQSWAGSGKVQLHGPGWSKVMVAADAAANVDAHVDLVVDSIARNGGRSCINASGVWTVGNGRALAEAAAAKLAAIEPRALDDPAAQLASFPDPAVAEAVSAMIDGLVEQDGVEDLTAAHRPGVSRVAVAGGCTFLRPTLLYVDDPNHPAAQTEFGFPFASVVELPSNEALFDHLGPTLVGTVITDDPATRRQAMACRAIDRLNLGAIPTFKMSWDQPHEGNLFDHLYQQRAFQAVAGSTDDAAQAAGG